MNYNLLNCNNLNLLNQIDWSQIIALLHQYIHFDETKSSFNLPIRMSTREDIEKMYNQTETFLSDFDDNINLFHELYGQINSQISFDKILTQVNVCEVLTDKQIFQITQIILSFFKAQTRFSYILISPFTEGLNKLNTLIQKEASLLFDENGDISYQKHPQLKSIYTKAQKLEKEIRIIISKEVNSNGLSKNIQYNQWDLIDNRFVIPIKSDSYHTGLGTIISKSNKELTLFVEPHFITKLNSQRIEALSQLDAQLYKIYLKITLALKEYKKELLLIFKFSLDLDLTKARASFSNRYKLKRPTFSEKRDIKIKSFFHPLISNAIENDFNLEENKFGLCLSGPNTGGKSILLKSLVLCFTFPHLGLFIPAKEASFPLSSSVFYFSNDFQNISEGLSSFAAEATNYLSSIKEMNESSVVFIDEIFNTTGGQEATSLAIAIFKHISTKKNLRLFVSTHHQKLKTILHQDTSFLSASMGFNENENRPTYKIIYGPPGSSFALEIFESLEKEILNSNSIVKSAGLTEKDLSVQYETALAQLMRDKQTIQDEYNDLEIKKKAFQSEIQSLKSAQKLEIEQIKKSQKEEFQKLLKKTQKALDDTRKERVNTIKNEQKELDLIKSEAKSLLHNDYQKATSKKGKSISTKDIIVGGVFFIDSFSKKAKVLALNERKKLAHVLIGKLKTWVSYDDIYETQQKSQKYDTSSSVKISILKETRGNIEIDCRGMRLEEFIAESEPRIYEVINGEIPFLTIVHGHGHGILKDWLRKFLKKHPEIKWGNVEGNDGCTRIELKK